MRSWTEHEKEMQRIRSARWRDRHPGALHWDREKQREAGRLYSKTHKRPAMLTSKQNYEFRQRNKEKFVLFQKQRRQELNRLKMKPCMDCKVQYNPWVMHFDHRDPSTKLFNVCQNPTRNWEKILKEIDKCDLVCSNCHAERTYRYRLEGKIKFHRTVGLYESTLRGG